MRPSLLSRLFLLLGLLGAGFLGLAFHLYRTTEHLLTDELRKELAGDVAWMDHLFRADPTLLEPARADSLAKAVSGFKGYRITVIGRDGEVLGDSYLAAGRVEEAENHFGRPEIAAARERGFGSALRYSETVGAQMFYLARVSADGAVVRIAAGPATLNGFRDAALKASLLALLLFFAAAAVLTLWIYHRIRKPLLRLRGEARDVSKPLRWNAPFREAEILNEAFTDYAEAVQKLAAEVRQERDRLRALLSRLEEGVLLLDEAGRVRTANASARALLPLRAPGGPLEGKAFSAMVSHEGLNAWVAAQSASGTPGVYQLDKGDDSPVDLLCRLRRLGGGGGEAPEILITLVDVTRLRNLDRAKTDFVANASHELKTPLSSILGYAETLIEGALENPKAREPFVRKIHVNALRLKGLVQDLLNLSQLESQAPPRAEPLSVRDFTQAAWTHHRAEAERNGIRFENRVPPGLQWNVEPRDLDLMLGNLVGNAVKYNPAGGKVRVEWDAEARALSVRDTGHGIPPEVLPHVFERFYRADAARARGEGTGLGLAIVKHAAQRYGIQVSAESALGQGSVFKLAVPAEAMGS